MIKQIHFRPEKFDKKLVYKINFTKNILTEFFSDQKALDPKEHLSQ